MNDAVVNPTPRGESYFDGGLFQYLGWLLLGIVVTIFTLGICFPWACCMLYRWEVKHTVINGRRLEFDGTAFQLFGNWIKWWLLTLITLGIYGFWVNIKLKKWITKHTKFKIDTPFSPNTTSVPPAIQPIPTAPAPVQQKQFTLKSKDLVTADGMLAYCKHFGFTGGVSESVCKDLFKKAEGAVAPDNEVVMAFIAAYDYEHENENPEMCACVCGATRFIIATSNNIDIIPIVKINLFLLTEGEPLSILRLCCLGKDFKLGVEREKDKEIEDFCQKSLYACKGELDNAGCAFSADIPDETKYGDEISYKYNDVACTIYGDTSILGIGSVVYLDYDGHINNVKHEAIAQIDNKKLRKMASDYRERGDTTTTRVSGLDDKLYINIGFYRDYNNDEGDEDE